MLKMCDHFPDNADISPKGVGTESDPAIQGRLTPTSWRIILRFLMVIVSSDIPDRKRSVSASVEMEDKLHIYSFISIKEGLFKKVGRRLNTYRRGLIARSGLRLCSPSSLYEPVPASMPMVFLRRAK